MSIPILDRFIRTRARTEALTTTLSAEDMQVQSMPDASPTKWHLGHTTWFFETFVLEPLPGFEPVDERYRIIFNSYYEQVGAKHPRPERGLLTRPALSDVLEYRQRITRDLRTAPEGTGSCAGRHARTGHQSRGAASGTAPDGHQAHARVERLRAIVQGGAGAAVAPTVDQGWHGFRVEQSRSDTG